MMRPDKADIMKRLALLAILFVLPCEPAAASKDRKTVEPGDLVSLRNVREARVSPDGRVIAYLVDAEQKTTVWLVSTDGKSAPRPFVLDGESAVSPAWTPDGKFLTFLSKRENPLRGEKSFHFSFSDADAPGEKSSSTGDAEVTSEHATQKGRQIWMIPLDGGGVIPLTDIPGGIKKFKWSRNGKLLAFVRRDPEAKVLAERRALKADEVEVDKNYRYDRLWVFDLATRQARLLTPPDLNIVEFDWSPDGKRIAASASATPRVNDVENVLKIVVFDTATGHLDKAFPGNAGERIVRWSPTGSVLAFFKLAPTTDTTVPVLYDVDSGAETVIGSDIPATVKDMVWDRQGNSLTATVLKGVTFHLVKIDARSGALSESGTFEGSPSELSASVDGETLAYVQETRDHPGEVHARVGGRERRLTHANTQVESWNLGTEQPLTWTSSKDGRSIYGVLLLPPGYDKNMRYKTVVHLHGGPTSAWDLGFHGTWYDWGRVLASHGYVVLLPNPRGSEGGGTSFSEAIDRNWGDAELQDIMDGVDVLISRGIADPARLGIGGWSYGGYLTAWAVTHTDRFKVAVAGAAIADLISMATTTDIAPDFLTRFYGDLTSHRDLYDVHSPIRFLEHCHTPTLVLHGEADTRVPISQGEEFYNGLRFMGRETQMVRYPREWHFFDEDSHRRDSMERMLHWYDSHLN
ncbi:S9 family peptidase [Dokdonella soli]|uniref:S9 family peptidase n=1 Tax=Dokdonella soli TaxID=529810 RepID=A0ABP3U7Z1_9GAMM